MTKVRDVYLTGIWGCFQCIWRPDVVDFPKDHDSSLPALPPIHQELSLNYSISRGVTPDRGGILALTQFGNFPFRICP